MPCHTDYRPRFCVETGRTLFCPCLQDLAIPFSTEPWSPFYVETGSIDVAVIAVKELNGLGHWFTTLDYLTQGQDSVMPLLAGLSHALPHRLQAPLLCRDWHH